MAHRLRTMRVDDEDIKVVLLGGDSKLSDEMRKRVKNQLNSGVRQVR